MTPPEHSWQELLSRRVIVLAVLLTLLNLFKPITIDDPTYLRFAQQIARDPTDPYGGTYFWYEEREPSNHILAPAFFLYYLALVIRLVGSSVLLLKLSLLPWAWLLVVGFDRLLTRFAPGQRSLFLVVAVLSPALVPGFNLMLDVPALALALLAIDRFLTAQETCSFAGAVAAGVLTGLAMQTKYTAFTVPVVILGAALVRGRWVLAVLSVGLAVSLFAGWEAYLQAKYGESHFLVSAGGQGGISGLVARAAGMLPFFLSYLGGLACILLLMGLWVSTAPRWVCAITLGVVLAVHGVLVVLDSRLTNDTRPSPLLFGPSTGLSEVIQPAEPIFILLGVMLPVVLGLGIVRLWYGEAPPRRWELLFLGGWFLVEAGASLVLSPFPAARRLFGVLAVATLVVARMAAASPAANGIMLRGLVGAQVLLALGYAGLDFLGAWVHRNAAERAASWVAEQHEPGTVWFVGHWGFQYYAEEAGMRSLQSDYSPTPDRIAAGDWIVVPDPRVDQQSVRLNPSDVELRETLRIPALVPVRTVSCYHGGRMPIEHFEGDALEVRIYRANRETIAHFGLPEKFHQGY